MPSKEVPPDSLDDVMVVVGSVWANKDMHETALNGWPTLSAIQDASYFADSYARKAVRKLKRQGRIRKVKSKRDFSSSGEVMTVTPAHAVDKPEVSADD